MTQQKNMLIVWRFVLGVSLSTSLGFSAFEFQSVGWAAAAANIRVVGAEHPDRLMINPALLKQDFQCQTGFQYSRPFDGLDLQAGSLAMRYYIRTRPVISGFTYFGDEFYSEMMLTSGTAWSISPGFQVGASLNLFRLSVAEYDTHVAGSFSASMSLALTEKIQLGSVLQHVAQFSNSMSLPQRFHFGAAYDSDPMLLLFALEKEAALPLDVCVALVTSPKRKWQFAIGYRDLSRSISAGWRLRFGNFGMHYTSVINPELPISHGLGVELIFP